MEFLDEQACTHSNMLGKGLNSLPDEILLEIVALVVEVNQPSLAALELSHVCRRFRSLALSSPRIWSYIHPASQSHKLVTLYAERNKSLGLNITLTNKHFSPNWPLQVQFLETVVFTQAHWRTLSIEADNRGVDDLLDLLHALRRNAPLPGLKHFRIKASPFYSQPFTAEEMDKIVALYSSLQADNIISLVTTDLVPNPLPASVSHLTVHLHAMRNFNNPTTNDRSRNPSDRVCSSIKELSLIFHCPDRCIVRHDEALSDSVTTFGEVEFLRITTPHSKNNHVNACSLFSSVRLPKLRTVMIDYDFKAKYEAKPKDMDLHNMDYYYLQAPLFGKGIDCLDLKLYNSCRVDHKRQLRIAFNKMPPVRELRIETPHLLASLGTYMDGKRIPAFHRVVFRKCANLTTHWLDDFVSFLRRDAYAWTTLDEIFVDGCPLVDIKSLKEILPHNKLLYR